MHAVLAYPVESGHLSGEKARTVLRDVGLGYLQDKLEAEDVRWDQTLSGGERQRLAFARLLLEEPDIIIMDEATAALDIDSEFRLLTQLFERLPRATIISVGHRPGLQELHSRLLTLKRHPKGGRIVQTKRQDRDAWRKLRVSGPIPRRTKKETDSRRITSLTSYSTPQTVPAFTGGVGVLVDARSYETCGLSPNCHLRVQV